MKKLMMTALMAVGLCGFALAESADEAAVRDAHDRFLKAANAGDGAALGKFLAAGLQYSHSNTKLETREDVIAALTKSKANFELHSQTIHVYGKTATIRAKITSHAATGDVPMTMLQVWVKNGNQWQMVERQTTRIPAQ